ncbi:MAG: hypothetical protein IJP78_07820 [Clostridia bacterium]|nr:hypothetical protein [Clostridia bacterium]
MKYSAKYNTADPKIGFVSVGEVLTDAQVKALGQEKIDELVKGGLLIEMRDAPKAETAAPVQEETREGEAEEREQDETEPEETGSGEDEEDEDAEIPEPDDMSDIVPEGEADKPEAAADSKRGRRKKANEGKDSGNGQD